MKAKILENRRVIDGVYRLILDVGVKPDIKPGQFANIYLNNDAKILPRPISICDVEGTKVTLVYGLVGEGTKELASYKKGQEIRVLGPLGNGFDLKPGKSILIGGGIGIPPLVYLAKNLDRPIAILGFKVEDFLLEKFMKYCSEVYVAVEGNYPLYYRGNVIDLMKEYELSGENYYSCGPKPMLNALNEYLPSDKLQVSLEERMGCGYGACVGCTCETKDGAKKVCKDGPVFYGNEVIF